ncbi:unnamed protein product [Oppiella nova]|uniref:NWD2 C-terminal beta-propeller domain-containing protein n=1 Tax=Oppiella nova TaxID=334625 RepID=A0A7R9LBT9_9ACAR|nr:unnamed protein product [Oppiella nova]CAG2161948.1 unnamed protein product [Oppiella nova]
MGVWGGGVEKPFKYTEPQKERFKLIEEESKADRKVPTQPLAYFSVDGRITRYNLRKLAELPYHLIRAKRFNDLLKTFPNMIGPQILARLLCLRDDCPNIRNLLKQCDTKGALHCALLPVNHCLHTPGGPLIAAIALNKSRTIVFVGDLSNKVCYHRRRRNRWSPKRQLSTDDIQTGNQLLSLQVFKHKFLVALHLRGFYIWTIDSLPLSDKCLYLPLPHTVRNISIKPLKCSNPIVFSKTNQYLMAGVRKSLYIYCLQSSQLLKTLDAHFARIVQIKSYIVDDLDAIVTSSFDKTIKVWNIKNLFERVHTIDKMDLPIDSISFSSQKNLALTVTRNSVGIWSLERAQLLTTLSDSKIGAIVTHAIITDDARYVLSIENDNFLVWDLNDLKIVFKEQENNVKDLIVCDNDSKALIIRQVSDENDVKNMVMSVRAVPTGDKLYRGKETVVGLIGGEFSYILDVLTQRVMTRITRWNGQIDSSGKFGLFVPQRGGLELIDLKYGSTLKVLLPHTSEGVVRVMTGFTSDNSYVFYYHTMKKTIRKDCVKHLNELPSRMSASTLTQQNPFKTWRTVAKLAVIAAKTQTQGSQTDSKTCVLS